MKIYVVTQGEYSDYHIITATTDKSIAKAIVKKFQNNGYYEPKIEEYENAEIMLKPCWSVFFYDDGTIHDVIDGTYSPYSYEDVGTCCRVGRNRQFIRVVVSADSKEAAIKIAAEKRAKRIAEEAGL